MTQRPVRRMAYSRLGRLFQGLQDAYRHAQQRRLPVTEILDADGIRRRRILQASMAAGATLGVGPALVNAATAPRIAIIGAGLAGLACAHGLQRLGYRATIHEASPWPGGRIFTTRDFFADGIGVERGGEFISTEHTAVRNLARRFNLPLEEVASGSLPEGEPRYFVNGGFYSVDQAVADWGEVFRIFKKTLQAAPWPPRYDAFTAEHRRLDFLPIPDWLDEIGIGARSDLGQLMQATAISEYGHPPEQQSALNLLYLLAWNPKNSLEPLAGTDERLHIEGGNDRLVDALVASLPAGSIRTEQALEAVHGDLPGPFRLHFSDGSVTVCDRLVLAIPFSTLRDVALSPHILAAMRPVKRWAIQTQEMGSNAKLHIQCQGRPWSDTLLIDGEPSQGNGAAYSGADGFITVWDAAVNHPGPRAVLCDYLGGEQGRNLRGPAFGEAHRDDVRRLLAQMELVFPGTEAAYTGHALVSSWIDYPWSRGSYSSPTLGHYTGFFGAAGLPEGNIHFAGEHADVEFFGFLEGAVESGQRAAREIHTG